MHRAREIATVALRAQCGVGIAILKAPPFRLDHGVISFIHYHWLHIEATRLTPDICACEAAWPAAPGYKVCFPELVDRCYVPPLALALRAPPPYDSLYCRSRPMLERSVAKPR